MTYPDRQVFGGENCEHCGRSVMWECECDICDNCGELLEDGVCPYCEDEAPEDGYGYCGKCGYPYEDGYEYCLDCDEEDEDV